jgi:hypothetical protein
MKPAAIATMIMTANRFWAMSVALEQKVDNVEAAGHYQQVDRIEHAHDTGSPRSGVIRRGSFTRRMSSEQSQVENTPVVSRTACRREVSPITNGPAM